MNPQLEKMYYDILKDEAIEDHKRKLEAHRLIQNCHCGKLATECEKTLRRDYLHTQHRSGKHACWKCNPWKEHGPCEQWKTKFAMIEKEMIEKEKEEGKENAVCNCDCCEH